MNGIVFESMWNDVLSLAMIVAFSFFIYARLTNKSLKNITDKIKEAFNG